MEVTSDNLKGLGYRVRVQALGLTTLESSGLSLGFRLCVFAWSTM